MRPQGQRRAALYPWTDALDTVVPQKLLTRERVASMPAYPRSNRRSMLGIISLSSRIICTFAMRWMRLRRWVYTRFIMNPETYRPRAMDNTTPR